MNNDFDEDNDDSLPGEPTELEKVRDFHGLYLRAVNNPVRRKILELLSAGGKTTVVSLQEKLESEGLCSAGSPITFHLSFLEKAECITLEGDSVEITKGGKVVDCLDK